MEAECCAHTAKISWHKLIIYNMLKMTNFSACSSSMENIIFSLRYFMLYCRWPRSSVSLNSLISVFEVGIRGQRVSTFSSWRPETSCNALINLKAHMQWEILLRKPPIGFPQWQQIPISQVFWFQLWSLDLNTRPDLTCDKEPLLYVGGNAAPLFCIAVKRY